MFLAQLTSNQIVLPFFLNKIEDVLNNKESLNKKFVDKVIIESASVVKGDQFLYNVDNEYFDIVKILVERYTDALRNLTNPNIQNYIEIKKILA